MRRMTPGKEQGTDDLHGNVSDNCRVALLLFDVINDLDFPVNAGLLKVIPKLSRTISALKNRCKGSGVPMIYANDNRGRWRSDFAMVLAHCMRADAPGRPLAEALAPAIDDYVVLKTKHSAFYATPLDTLLAYLKTKVIILAGLTTSACILLTAGALCVCDFEIVLLP